MKCHQLVPYLAKHRLLGDGLYYATLVLMASMAMQAIIGNAAWAYVAFPILAAGLFSLHVCYRMQVEGVDMDEICGCWKSVATCCIPWITMLGIMAGSTINMATAMYADGNIWLGALASYGAFSLAVMLGWALLVTGLVRKTEAESA